jgi:hypothetical protein
MLPAHKSLASYRGVQNLCVTQAGLQCTGLQSPRMGSSQEGSVSQFCTAAHKQSHLHSRLAWRPRILFGIKL